MTTDTLAPSAPSTAGYSPRILDFLKTVHPSGPWTITQINESGLNFATFSEREQGPLINWLGDRNGKTNLYWNINPTALINGKSKLQHITSVPRFHVDLDPRKDKDWQEERALILRILGDEELLKRVGLPGKPTLVIDSGGGFWGFWELEQAIDIVGNSVGELREAAAEVGRYNRWIAETFNDALHALNPSPVKPEVADACHNVDRIARLPFTINFPDEKKIKAGRTVALTSVVGYWPERVYRADQFKKSDVISYGAAASDEELAAVQIGTIERTLPGDFEPFDIAQELQRLYPQVGAKCIELIVLGHYVEKEIGADDINDKLNNNGELDTNRSRAHWRVNRHLQQVGVPLNVILGILCDERLPISAYGRQPLDKKANRFGERSSRELIRFTEIQIKKCATSIAKQRAREAEFDTLVNGLADGTTQSSRATSESTPASGSPQGNGSAPSTVPGVIDYLNREHAVLLQEGGKTRVLSWERSEIDYSREIPVLQTFDDFRNRYMHRMVSVGTDARGQPQLKPWGEVWLKHVRRKQYLSLRFLPGQPEEVDGYLNMWRGFAVEPVPGDWSLMQRHIRETLACGSEEVAEYILNWSAWAVQHPDEPAEVAMVFKGEKGTGKGVFARAIKRLFGQHGLQITSPAQLTGRFKSHLRDCCLLFADEAIVPEDKKAESVLKGLITEPELAVEGKGANVIQARNRLHIIMASNEEWVVPAGVDERRFAIFEVSRAYRQNEAYFKALADQLNNGGLAAMLQALLTRDISGWHPRRGIPQTEALRAQKEKSLKPFESFMINLAEEGVFPCLPFPGFPNAVPSRDVGRTIGLFNQMRNTAPELKNYSDKRLAMELRKWNCVRHSNGNKRGWEFPPLAELRALIDDRYWKMEWVPQENWPAEAEPHYDRYSDHNAF